MTSEPSPDSAREHAKSNAFSLSNRNAWLLLLLPLSWFLWTGQRGLSYGEHWDEAFQIQMVQHSVEEETLLPDWYNYPSVSYWLSFAALTPELLEADWSGVGTRGPLHVGAPIKGDGMRSPYPVIEVKGYDGEGRPDTFKDLWSIQGKVLSKNEAVIDFSPKGGPADLLAKISDDGTGIVFPDGNKWTKVVDGTPERLPKDMSTIKSKF